MADNMQATPMRRPTLGALAKLLAGADTFARKPFGYNNPPAQLISDMLGVPGTQRTLERLAYDEPLTTGKGFGTKVRDDTLDAALNAPGALGKLAMMTKDLPVGAIIKPKGGNWLSGSPEVALEHLKKYPVGMNNWAIRNRLIPEDFEAYKNASALPGVTDIESQLKAAGLYDKYASPDPLNSWIDKQLTRYVKNEMATPEDPIRALAERGVLHTDLGGNYRVDREANTNSRNLEKLGQSQLAQHWENASDSVLNSKSASDLLKFKMSTSDENPILERNPWLAKVPPETMAYGAPEPWNLAGDLGFTHLVDELRNAVNPTSGLPPELLLKYASLPKVSVPQAVERVAKINEWRAAHKAEADLARANGVATALHKDYPDRGFKWVELKKPTLEGGSELAENRLRSKEYVALEDALKYEGDTMGHCVGGYCPDVLDGKSRIFSLRDAKGQPHVTIEAGPPKDPPTSQIIKALTKEEKDAYKAAGWDGTARSFSFPRLATVLGRTGPGPNADIGEGVKLHKEVVERLGLAPSIVQIKGKSNKAPNEEYLPFVQDFVKSGKWSDVGDLGNTGLIDLSRSPKRMKALGRYATDKELTDYLDSFPATPPAEPGFAHGGVVISHDKIDQWLSELG